jgi:hypothetical protein
VLRKPEWQRDYADWVFPPNLPWMRWKTYNRLDEKRGPMSKRRPSEGWTFCYSTMLVAGFCKRLWDGRSGRKATWVAKIRRSPSLSTLIVGNGTSDMSAALTCRASCGAGKSCFLTITKGGPLSGFTWSYRPPGADDFVTLFSCGAELAPGRAHANERQYRRHPY